MEISSTLQDQFANAFDVEIGATGFARFYTAAYALKLATCSMNAVSFGASSSGLITMATASAVEDASPVAGVAALMAIYKNSTDAATLFVAAFGVATSGTPDVDMANTTIVTTDTVQVSSLTIQVPTGATDAV